MLPVSASGLNSRGLPIPAEIRRTAVYKSPASVLILAALPRGRPLGPAGRRGAVPGDPALAGPRAVRAAAWGGGPGRRGGAARQAARGAAALHARGEIRPGAPRSCQRAASPGARHASTGMRASSICSRPRPAEGHGRGRGFDEAAHRPGAPSGPLRLVQPRENKAMKGGSQTIAMRMPIGTMSQVWIPT